MNLTDGSLQWLISAAAFVVSIGVLVAVHEFGHFWVARKLGIKVLRFSLGFGKPLYRRIFSNDRVEFVVAAIPLGGYVKLLDEREGNVAPEDAPRAFNRQPVWKRIAVLLAGPLFNLVFAVLLYWILFVAGVTTYKAVVGDVSADSIAQRAGLKFEDEIVAVGGVATPTLEAATLQIIEDLTDDGTIQMRVRGADGAERDLELVAGERSRELTQPDALLPGLGFNIWRPRLPAVIDRVMDDTAASRAGLEAGDRIVAFDGRPIESFNDLLREVEPAAGRAVTLQVRREGELLDVPLTVGSQNVGGRTVGLIGIAPVREPIDSGRTVDDLLTVQKYGPLAALSAATVKTWDMSIFTLRILGRIVTRDVSLKAISGPLSIAETTGFAVRQGLAMFLGTLAVISVSLGVLNLLPIPILDGGQIVYQLAELVKGRPVSERAQIVGQQLGIAMLLLMMTLAFYNDIARIVFRNL